MGSNLPIDNHGQRIQVFTPRAGVTLTSPYLSSEDAVYVLGADVTITLDGVAVPYYSGSNICLSKGVSYTLSASTPAHKM